MKIEKSRPYPQNDLEIWDHVWGYDELHDLAAADPDHSGFLAEWYEAEGGNWVDDSIDGWLDYIRNQVAYFGLVFDDENRTVTFSITNYKPAWSVRHQFEGIDAVFDLIDKAYEHSGPRAHETSGWGPMLPDLGGDDDVDYQSSIPSMCTSFIQHLLFTMYPE